LLKHSTLNIQHSTLIEILKVESFKFFLHLSVEC
jgi:hypothetical protein